MNVTTDELCVMMLFNKLPTTMREVLRRSLKTDWLDLDKFIEAYNEEVRNLEASNSEPESQAKTAPTAAFAIQRESPEVSHVRRETVNQMPVVGCKLCNKQNHFWYVCYRYNDPASKIKRAKELKLCIGCLDREFGKKGMY